MKLNPLALIALLLILLAPALPAPAQPSMDPAAAQQIAALEARVQELEEALARAEARVAELEAALAAAQGGAAPGEPGLTLPADKPTASPDAALVALKASYADTFKDRSFATDAEKADYNKTLRSWLAAQEREFRGHVEWVCTVSNREVLTNGDQFLTVEVIDPDTGDLWSRPFVLEIPRRQGGALARLDLSRPLVVGGIFQLDLTVNENRPEEGMFNDPPFVGAFVEYGYNFRLQSISQYVPPRTTDRP